MIALACERPSDRGQRLSRYSAAEIVREAIEKGLLPMISPTTVLRWSKEAYQSAQRVFFVVDDGFSHRPDTFGAWLSATFPNALAVHLPIHASWLNQIEIYFSILQRKALTPNDLKTTNDVSSRILKFE